MSTPKSYYDVVVLGGETAGLVAGCLLAKIGYRVAIVLPRDDEQSSGEEPPLLIAGGRTSVVASWVFSQLGLVQEMRTRLRPLDPGCQVVLPGHRIDLARRGGDIRVELNREFPDATALVDSWMAMISDGQERLDGALTPPPLLPPTGMRDSRAWRNRLRMTDLDGGALEAMSVLGSLPPDHGLRAVAAAATHFLSRLGAPQRPGPGPFRLLSLLASDGIWVADGGRAGFASTLLQRLSTYGGSVLRNGEAGELVTGWRGKDMVVETEKEALGCRVVVHAGDARQLPALLPSGTKRRRLETDLDGVREIARRKVFDVLASPDVTPAGLGPLTVVDPQDGGDPILVMSEQVDGATRFRVVYDEALESDPGRPPAADRARLLLDGLVPFLDEHLLPKPADDKGLEAAVRPGMPIYAAPPVESSGGFSILGHRTPFKQLFLAGHQVLPGLGFEGDLLAGAGCAALVSRQVKRKDLLGK